MANANTNGTGVVNGGLTLTKILVALNVVIYVLLCLRGDPQSADYMLHSGALYLPAVLENHEFYRLVTAVFMHFSVSHLFNNMLLLFFMGDVLEDEIGKIRFALLYLLSGIAGNAVTLALQMRTGSYSVSAGASGAVFGVLGGLLCLLILRHGHVSYLTGGRMAFFVLYSLFTGFSSAGVNNIAHVSGLAAGFVLMLILSAGLPHSGRIYS